MISVSPVNFSLTMEGFQSTLRNKVRTMCKMGNIPPTTVKDLLFHEEEGSYINLKLL